MRRILLLLVAALAVAAPAALAKAFPETIPLPNGWLPEGIAVKGNTFYAGSRADGAIYRGDLRTGQGSTFIQGEAGRVATGLKVARGLLFVSGANTGQAFVFDVKTGKLVHEYQLATGAAATFINDVTVTKDAAYFTDSNRPVIYKVALGKKHEPAATAQTIALTGEYQHVAGFNLNGIAATPSGKTLLAVQTATGKLFTIDPATGATKAVDTGGVTFANGDGILLQGKTLYVVQNADNKIAVVKLSDKLTAGTVVRYITDSDFDVPTTIARKGKWLYAVNARFTTPATPTTTYNVVQVER